MPHVVATAVEHNLPAVWVLQNNYAIGTIRDLQRVYHGGREIGTSFVNERPGQLSNPDFAKMAEAMGGRGIRIEHPDQFGDAYREAIRSNVPTVLDVIINRDTSQRSSRLSASHFSNGRRCMKSPVVDSRAREPHPSKDDVEVRPHK